VRENHVVHKNCGNVDNRFRPDSQNPLFPVDITFLRRQPFFLSTADFPFSTGFPQNVHKWLSLIPSVDSSSGVPYLVKKNFKNPYLVPRKSAANRCKYWTFRLDGKRSLHYNKRAVLKFCYDFN
jgi:hypothetical protein